jgi:hypothetical protein
MTRLILHISDYSPLYKGPTVPRVIIKPLTHEARTLTLISFPIMVRFFYQILAVSALLKSANSACNYGTSHYPRLPSVPVNKFSYVGFSGPLNWYGLNETANVLCSTGMY